MASLRRVILFIFAVPMVLPPFFLITFLFYYQVNVNTQLMSPLVELMGSSYADMPGFVEVVHVGLGAEGVPLKIIVYPTYQTAYYRDIIRIRNRDRRAYNVFLVVASPMNLPLGGRATLYVYEGGAEKTLRLPLGALPPSGCVAYINLTSVCARGFPIDAGETFEIDLLIYLPEGLALPESASADIYLLIDVSSESPPQ